jgi:pimeloyl-ACP methyl ester carboxylesterase
VIREHRRPAETESRRMSTPNSSETRVGTNAAISTFIVLKAPGMARGLRIAQKAVVIYVAVSVAVAILMAEMTLHPWRRPLPDKDKERIAHIYAPYSAILQPVIINAADGAELHAWYSVSMHDNGNAVILLHGIGDNRLGVAGYGQVFLQQGYRVLLPDSRAHGESGGSIATYGLLESDDVHRWVSWLYERGATCVDGFGESMGAALVLESMGEEPRFCAIVADSPFSTFRSVAYDREGYFVGVGRLGLEPVVGRTIGLLPAEIALRYVRWRYGVDLSQANPLDALKSSTIPVLLIHGKKDVNILPRHSLILARANPDHTQLWLVPEAKHGGAAAVAPQEFWFRVLRFLTDHDDGRPSSRTGSS